MEHHSNLEYLIQDHMRDEHLDLLEYYLTQCDRNVDNVNFDLNVQKEINQSISPKADSKNLKNFKCEDCEKVYKSKENLTLHIKNIHLKIKPYSCKYCIAEFSHRNGSLY